MLPCQAFYQALQDVGVGVFAGVPDSLLKDFCAYVSDHAPESAHTITANEGAAVALVCGHHLATGERETRSLLLKWLLQHTKALPAAEAGSS